MAAGTLAAWLLPVADWTTRLAAYAADTGPTGVIVFFSVYVVSTVALLPGVDPDARRRVCLRARVGAGHCLAGQRRRRDLRVRAGPDGAARVGGASSRRSPRMRAIDAAVEREGFKLVLLLRLSPCSRSIVLNYALSLSRVSLGRTSLASAIGMLPGTALYVYLGSLAPAAAALSSATGGGELDTDGAVCGRVGWRR